MIGNFKNQITSVSVIKSKLLTILGFICCIFLILFLMLSIPVYLLRQVVVWLAKVFRPEFGDILNGQTAVFVDEYFFEGSLTFDEVQVRVMKNWIRARDSSSGRLVFENFQRYPVNWLGFTFWKDASRSFSIDNHVHKFAAHTTEINDVELTKLFEKLLNEKLPRKQSPWRFYVIENYALSPLSSSDTRNGEQKYSVLVFNWHHCLSDGSGLLTAFINGLFEKPVVKLSARQRQPTKTISIQRVLRILTLPIAAFTDMSYFLSHYFRSSPLKIPDEKKRWHQMYAKSGVIPMETIKDIKNRHGVSFTSVILSAISSAVHNTLEAGEMTNDKSILCLSVLPARGIRKRKTLANHLTGAVFDLPISGYDDPRERLAIVNQNLESAKTSAIPMLAQYYSTWVGAHLSYFRKFFTKNKMIPIGSTNFAIMEQNVKWNNTTKWIHTEAIIGALKGETGVAVTAISHGREVQIQVCAEKALLSKEQLEFFMNNLKHEIDNLSQSKYELIHVI